MVRDRLPVHLLRLQLALRQQQLEELRVMRDLPLPVEVRVLVLEGVEAVRAGRDHAPYPDLVHRGDVRLRQCRVEELAAEAPRRVARARLLLSQHAEAHARLDQQPHHRLRDGHVALHQRPRAAHPVQVLLRPVEDGHLDALLAELLHPRLARELRAPPGMAALLDVLQRLLCRSRDARLLHHQVAAHVDDRGHMLDQHRALLHAGHARAAGPQRLVLHVVAHQLATDLLGRILARDQERPGVVHVRLQVLDDRHRRKRLARRVGRAGVRAAPAAHARVGVEELLPGEVLDLACAQTRALLDQLLEVAHRRQV